MDLDSLPPLNAIRGNLLQWMGEVVNLTIDYRFGCPRAPLLKRCLIMARLISAFVFCAIILQGLSAEPASSTDKSISQFVDKYFTAWSNKHFSVYRSCFHLSAAVTYQQNQEWRQWALDQFLKDQEYLQSQHRMQEAPTAIHVKALNGNIAFVEVPWKLQRQLSVAAITGIDWFTLVKHDQTWQILNLTFWQDSASSAQAHRAKPQVLPNLTVSRDVCVSP
jgi:hypothetical protein